MNLRSFLFKKRSYTPIPIVLTILNILSIIFEILPFIFLLGVMFFFINLFDKDEIELLRSHGINNLKITTIISLASLVMGIILIVVFYSFSANLKSLYLDNFNYQMYRDSIEGSLPRKKIRIRSYNNGKYFNRFNWFQKIPS